MSQNSGHGDAPPGWAECLARATLVGAGAALLVAFGDYGASWLWLADGRDRWELLLRLLGLEVPVGASAAVAYAVLLRVSRPATARLARRLGGTDARARRGWQRALGPSPIMLAAIPPLVLVAQLLFSGARASALPARGLWVGTAALLLVLGCGAALVLGHLVYERGRSATTRRFGGIVATSLALFFAVSKIDQYVYPKLYEYLHALLSVVGFGIAALASALLVDRSARLRRLEARFPRAAIALLAALAALFILDLVTLDRSQNVRVALFDPRAASSRSLMQGLEPLVPSAFRAGPSEGAVARARQARERRRRVAHGGLPALPDAHVLLVTIDALRADHLGLYGYGRPLSPHLDRLAEASVVFEQAYAAAPHSSYSLSSLMASEYLHETVDLGHALPAATLPSELTAEGIYTAALVTDGIFHTEGERLARYRDTAFGFARHDPQDLLAEAKTDQALEEIDRIVARGEPSSLLWVHYFDVHEPYRETHFGTSDIDRYDSEIRKVDRAFGRLLEQVRARLSREVVVVVSSDHGEEFRDHGGVYHGSTLYEEQVRVPLLVHVPGLPARRIGAPVELVDLAPTVLGLLDLPVPSSMRGDDLRPLMTGAIESLGPAFGGVMHKRMVVRWPHKLIADLRFDLYEIYDLAKDPRERINLAGQHPELLDSLKGEIYAWLDSLGQRTGQKASDPHRVALDRGHLGDRRAVEPLAALVADEDAPREMRLEAARLLARLADQDAAPGLARAMRSPDPHLAAEAAVALGRMHDERSRRPLRELVHSEDPHLRARAAVSLGRLRDPRAVPGLIDALWVGEDKHERREAVRWLGRLGDPRAVEPLVSLIPEFRLRRLVAVALGQIGDPRAYAPLVDILEWDRHPPIRDSVCRGLGQLGDPRAIPRLVHVALQEPDLKYPTESLVRLGALADGAVGGTDVGPTARSRLRGFGRCHAGKRRHDWNYLHRTWCESDSAQAALRLDVPDPVRAGGGAVAVLRLRRTDTGAGAGAEVAVHLGREVAARVAVDDDWSEHRWEVPAGALEGATLRASLRASDPRTRFAVDHLLLLPRPAPLAAAAGFEAAAQ